MFDQTQLDLASAFAMESRAAARNQAFALKAEQEGRAQDALFFRAAAQAQTVAARRLMLILRGKISGTEENLADAFGQDLPQRIKNYQEYVGRSDGPASSAFKQALEIGRHQEALYQRLRQGETDAYHVCTICGCLVTGSPPERCPVCGAVPEKFESVK
jgi:rubrerythrin